MYTINVIKNNSFIYRHTNDNKQSHLNVLEHLKNLYKEDLWLVYETCNVIDFEVKTYEYLEGVK